MPPSTTALVNLPARARIDKRRQRQVGRADGAINRLAGLEIDRGRFRKTR
jgi:hypothetical protein